MEITAEDRDFMHKIINYQIQNISQVAQFSMDERVKTSLEITNPHDFVMGLIYEKILGGITTYLTEKMKIMGTPSLEQLLEMMQVATEVTMERLGDIKQAVNQAIKE